MSKRKESGWVPIPKVKGLHPCFACDRPFKRRQLGFLIRLFDERIAVVVCARCFAKESAAMIRRLEAKMRRLQSQEPAFVHYKRRKDGQGKLTSPPERDVR